MKKLLSIFVIFFVLYFLSFIYLGSYTSQKYSEYNRAIDQEIDALVVFFGDFDDNGDLSRESLRRLSFSVDMYRKGIGKNIIFVGGCRPLKNLYGSEEMAKKAVERGVKPSAVFYDKTSRDTINNWKEAEKIIADKKFKNVILISSIYHLLRIEQMIEIRNDYKAFYAAYGEDNASPAKSLMESFSEYNYNIISIMAYLVFPSGLYQITIGKLRG